jgi:AAA domain, putative AbiEii toxin, Type IV TA system
MLLRFGIANYLSIKDRQELSLVASSLKDDESGLITPPATVKERVLPAAVIYGANASGKSNVVKSLEFMRHFALYSHSRGEPGKPTGVTPFALDPDCAGKASEFDIDFVAGGIRFAYRFSVTSSAVETEELIAYPHGRPQLWFSRKGQEFSFGKSLTGRNHVIADLVRPNSLFVSAAAQNDHEMLKGVVGFFVGVPSPLEIERQLYLSGDRRSTWHGDIDARIIQFLQQIGTGIVGYRLLEKPAQEMPQYSATTAIVSKREPEGQFAHERKSGELAYFDFHQESTGTKRLLILLEEIYKSIDAGTPIIVDEIEGSLHSKACEALVALFTSTKTNPRGAQLIATTHDTNLLRSPLLRRDQIWFTEKSPEGETDLYSLSDFSSRATDDFEKGYLQGRYGAVPFAGSARNLFRAA